MTLNLATADSLVHQNDEYDANECYDELSRYHLFPSSVPKTHMSTPSVTSVDR